MVAAVLISACGGGADLEPRAAEFAARVAREAATALPSRLIPAASTAQASLPAPSPDATALYDWAEYRFPEIFPRGPANADLVHNGVAYTVRVYPNGNIVGLTASGDVYGYGPFTSHRLTAFGNAAEYAQQVEDERCNVRPTLCEPGYVAVTSDIGDIVGQGRSHRYTQADARISVAARGGVLTITVAGDQSWFGTFVMPAGQSQLRPGHYAGLERAFLHDPSAGGLTWDGGSRACTTSTGTLTIDRVAYVDGSLTVLDLSFERHCERALPALRGVVRWYAGDATRPPGPAAAPAGLWRATPANVPASGNYVVLESQAGDHVGLGGTYVYTQREAMLSVRASNNAFAVQINGDEFWLGQFRIMDGAELQPGYYPGLMRYGPHNPVKGGLEWSGMGRGCSEVTGWLVIDSVRVVRGVLQALEARFEQRCDGLPEVLRGQIRWSIAEQQLPSGPVFPVPADLWRPPAGSTPTAGSYVYLQSEGGDHIGQGRTRLYTSTNAELNVSVTGAVITVQVAADTIWTGSFASMLSAQTLAPGYYGGLQRYPLHNPARGGMDWSGDSRGCNKLTGWFVIDSISFDNARLTALDLRFEQRCNDQLGALRGRIVWAAPG